MPDRNDMRAIGTVPEYLAPIADDLGLEEAGVSMLEVRGGEPPSKKQACVAALEQDLHPEGALLLFVEGAPPASELAAWRNVLWPLVHVVALYRFGDHGVVRETLQGTERIAEATPKRGVLLAGRPRALVLSPTATQAKFDLNAAAWAGDEASPGYAHYRWMRRYVGLFADVPPGARILDFGCGAGWVGIEAARIAPGSYLAFFDPSPAMVENAEHNARAAGIESFDGRVGFGEAPPFPGKREEPFDLVISSGVISFSPDHEGWMDGLTATVAPGGTLVVGDLNPGSRGMRARRRKKPLLPIRELNARNREDVRAGLERRGFTHERSAGYQLTWPIPQLMHVGEQRLGGALSQPLLWLNRGCAALDRALGSPLSSAFDSWVMRFRR